MKGTHIPYSAAERRWLADNRQLPRRELHERFCAQFGRTDVLLSNIKSYCWRAGWKTGRTGCFPKGNVPENKGKPFPIASTHPNCRRTHFKKGQLPHNTKYLGHERVSKDGYVEIQVAQPNPHTGAPTRYVHKHRWLWEQANGPIPKGMILKCLDGDKTNSDPSNWEMLPRAVLPRLNGKHTGLQFDQAAAEVKPLMLTAAKLEDRVRQARRKNASASR